MKREFKDLMIYKPYECLNSEITGDYDETLDIMAARK